jgi:chromosome segregation ATPase
MPERKILPLLETAYDVLAYVLKLSRHPKINNLYFDKNKEVYRRTKWGFEKADKYNMRIALMRKEKQYDQLLDDYDDVCQEYNQLLKRKTGLLDHLDMANEKLKESRKEKGFFKKHLKEVLDKNTSIEKRMERMLNQEDNLKQQIEKLKSTKDNLLESHQALTEKTRQQKAQINALQKTLEQLKEKLKDPMMEVNS